MSYKTLETAGEVRRWIVQIIVPSAIFTTAIISNPYVRAYISKKKNNIIKK